MKQGVRACYGASVVASVAGILVLLAGVVAMFCTVHAKANSSEYDGMRFTVAVVTAGFLVLLLGFGGCVYGFWWHLTDEEEKKPEPEKTDPPPPASPFHLAAPTHFMYAPPPPMFTPVYPGGYALPGQPDNAAPKVSPSGAKPPEVQPENPEEEEEEKPSDETQQNY
ncbi:homeobox protein slou-like [Limulus polyphemus]|uniref:Homeobox protein slou-like n=1 Tax=Limulus polyphemus TaxID=6850 RepID=A0ABM1T2M0_LIMPO|nr:homeobox protein slou-like [Limulus polyphemus]XP_022250127.1 homeobox protein slou-like [Limulus polyphemus]